MSLRFQFQIIVVIPTSNPTSCIAACLELVIFVSIGLEPCSRKKSFKIISLSSAIYDFVFQN